MTALLFSGTIWSLAFWFLFSVVGICVVAYYLIYYRQTKRWEKSNIPFLQPTFLIGHKYLLKLSNYSLTVFLDQVYKENSEEDVVGFFLGVLPMILVKNPNLFELIFSRGYGLAQMSFPSWILREGGVDMSHEEEDHFTRRGMSPLFSPNWYQGARFKIIKKEIYELRHTAENAYCSGSPITVEEVTLKAVRNIGGSNFGMDTDAHEMKERLYSIVQEFFNPSHLRSLMFFSVYLFPSLQVFDIFKCWSRKSRNIMSEFITHQINLKDQTNTESCDFIDRLQSIRTKEESKNIDSKDSVVSVISRGALAKMTVVGMGALIAGSDGMQKLSLFTIHTLSLHPECQRKIRSEIHEALKEQGVSELNYDVVRSLTYLECCLKESSRLYTGTYMVTKVCPGDFQIPGTKYILRKGDTVVLPLYSGNRDERNFKDPDLFNPDRFMSKDKDVPEILVSFGLGPTKCPGFTHALFTAAALVAALVQKYEIRPRSHPKLMDCTDFLPEGIVIRPRRDLLVDLVPCGNLDKV